MIKAGNRDEKIPKSGVRYGVHVVFMHYEPHGDMYAYVALGPSHRLEL
jgi:hypothetical protein